MAEASSSNSFHTISLSSVFNKEEILTLRDVMKKMCEDSDVNIALEEQLMAMKQEKDQLLQRLHEMEIQLHEAKETLTNTCMNIRYAVLVYLLIPLKMNVLVVLRVTQEE
jgi:hypothetical protein